MLRLIDEERLLSLLEIEDKLVVLEEGGVDNWVDYDTSMCMPSSDIKKLLFGYPSFEDAVERLAKK